MFKKLYLPYWDVSDKLLGITSICYLLIVNLSMEKARSIFFSLNLEDQFNHREIEFRDWVKSLLSLFTGPAKRARIASFFLSEMR